jgi:hypothetical protein
MYPLIEPQPYALQMQHEMIQQIEAAKPRFLIFVNVPTSWLSLTEPTSEIVLFDWFRQYQKQYYRVVGIVELVSEDLITYRWGRSAADYPIRSSFWVAVSERVE